MYDVTKYIRGQIWWYDDGYDKNNPTINSRMILGKRPAIVLASSLNTTIIPCSTGGGKLKTNIEISFNKQETTFALCEQVKTVDNSDLKTYMGVLDNDKLEEVTQMVIDYVRGEYTFTNIFIDSKDNHSATDDLPTSEQQSVIYALTTMSDDEKLSFIKTPIPKLKDSYTLSANALRLYKSTFEKELNYKSQTAN